jgi:transcriptional regulator with XRE-family HTH domain
MPTGKGPTTTRRRLRAELRALRQAKNLSVEDVTSEVEWSTSKLIRIENGQVGVSVSDLTALLQIYGLSDTARVNELKELARASRQRTWWSQYQRYLPASYLEFIGAESDAARIVIYHPTFIPGLLQTEEYFSALLEDAVFAPLDPAAAKARLDARLARQRHVLDRPDPPDFVPLVDESALRRPIGGTAVMRAQLDHLVAMAERDNVTLVVVPFSTGAHPGLIGTYALFEYGDALNDDVVSLENVLGEHLLRDDPKVLEGYRATTNRPDPLAAVGERKDGTDLP